MPPVVIALTSLPKLGPPTGSNTTRAPAPPVMRSTSATMSCSSVAMTKAAPASSSCWRLALLRVRAIGVAPTILASWIAASPTLLDAAGISTTSPASSLAVSIKAPYTEANIIQIDDASANDSEGGFGTTADTGASTSSPYMPYWFCENAGMVLTASPTANWLTPGPTASMMPAAS